MKIEDMTVTEFHEHLQDRIDKEKDPLTKLVFSNALAMSLAINVIDNRLKNLEDKVWLMEGVCDAS